MKWTQVPAGDINAANQRLWAAIGDNAEEVAARINADSAFVANITRLMVNGDYEPSTSQKLARGIMGKNFFVSEEILKSCRDTHILVAVFPLSILDIRGLAKKQSDRTLFCSQDWYDEQAFAKDKGKVGWQLVRKEPIANSTSKTLNDQQALLSKDEETPTARVVIYTMVGHFLATGEYLLDKIYVHCVDLGSDGNRVFVGCFDAEGLHVYDWYDDDCYVSIGLSAARKQ